MSDKLDASLENIFPDDPGTTTGWGRTCPASGIGAGGGGNGASADGFDLEDVAAAPRHAARPLGEQIALGFADPARRGIAAANWPTGSTRRAICALDPAEVAVRLGVDGADSSRRCCQAARPSTRPASLPATSPNASPSSLPRATASTRPCRRWSTISSFWPRDFPALEAICGVDEEDLLDMLAEIQALDPRPGLAFAGGSIDAIVPDVAGAGGQRRQLDGRAESRNPAARAGRPDLLSRRCRGRAKNQAEKDFLADCLQNANWLTRSLDQRAKTILKVASEIVRQQDAFLVHGVRHLRPLNLQDGGRRHRHA